MFARSLIAIQRSASLSASRRSLSTIQKLYTAEATATGAGRTGSVKSSDGVLDLSLVTPKGLGGSGGPHTNPEQLFAAGYSACFMGALQLHARVAKVALPPSTSVTAVVSIGKDPADGGFGLEAQLKVKAPGVEKQVLNELVKKAHQTCPYSKSTRGNIAVTAEAV